MESQNNINTVTITVDGKKINVPEGISIAAAVLGHSGKCTTGSNSVSGDPRAPYCLMGVCFECRMEVDGEPDIQSCLVAVQQGMVIKKQKSVIEAA